MTVTDAGVEIDVNRLVEIRARVDQIRAEEARIREQLDSLEDQRKAFVSERRELDREYYEASGYAAVTGWIV